MFNRLNAVPGVESVALTSDQPVGANGDTDWLRFEAHPYNGEHNEVAGARCDAGLFPDAEGKAGARTDIYSG